MADKQKKNSYEITDRNLHEYLDMLASEAPVPGGGGVAALAGSLAAALGSMVCRLTQDKPAYKAFASRAQDIICTLEDARARFLELSNLDAVSFEPVLQALRLSRDTKDQQEQRNKALEQALCGACEVPFEVMELACCILVDIEDIAQKGSRMAVADAGVAASLLYSTLQSAALSIRANVAMMKDEAVQKVYIMRIETLLEQGKKRADTAYECVCKRI